MKINGPIGIKCADIYLRFPEIMEEEFDELIEFLNDNNIRYEGATKKFQQLNNLVNSCQQLNNLVNSCQQEIRNLKSTLEKIREYIKYNATSNYFDADTNMFRREVDILQIIEESDVK